MKGKIAVTMVALVAIALIVGCAGVQKVVKQPEIAAPKTGPLAKIVVGIVTEGEIGGGTSINVGGIVYYAAKGLDANDNEVPIKPTWSSDPPGYVELTPEAGGMKVKIKGLKEGPTAGDDPIDIIAEYGGVRGSRWIKVKKW